MRSMVAISVLALFVFPALPAQAEWDVKAKLTCYESFDGKGQKLKGSNTDLIAACLGVEPEHPSIAEHAVTFDSDSRELHVLRRSDCVEICEISAPTGCQEAISESSSQIKSQRDALVTANEQLTERRMFMEAVLTGVSAGVLGLDADGRIAASVNGRVPTTQTLLSLVEKVLDE